MNKIADGFKQDEWATCESRGNGCMIHFNYFKLCENLNTKWNNGEKQRCPNLVCNNCRFCSSCISSIWRKVTEIEKFKKIEEDLMKEHGVNYLDIKDFVAKIR